MEEFDGHCPVNDDMEMVIFDYSYLTSVFWRVCKGCVFKCFCFFVCFLVFVFFCVFYFYILFCIYFVFLFSE